MPIYEFYCDSCNMIFNFFSSSVNTEKRPLCPCCGKIKLERRLSVFSVSKNLNVEDDNPLPDIDENRLEQAMGLIAREAEHINEDDPRQAANLMRKLTDMTGLDLGPGMEEALNRKEAGEDPEKIEAEMGDLFDMEDMFELKGKAARGPKKHPPRVDEKLYTL